jgi:ABC-2 type transport system ATP-binding protein
MTTALEIRGLRKTYPNGFEAVKGIDLEVEQGDFFALLGPNGAGKSTTINILCSLVRKSAGEVKVFGHDIDTAFASAKRQIGIVPQEFNFNQFEKVGDIVRTQGGYYGLPAGLARERAEIYLRKLDLWDKRDVQARMLSGGMKRRLMIARSLVHEPRLLILDEPTAGVDIELRRSMWAFLQEINSGGTTIILTTHYLEEAEHLCRRIAIIDNGEIVENSSMRDLLMKLQTEVFVLDVDRDLPSELKLDGYPMRVVDSRCLEVSVDKAQSLNEVFAFLTERGLRVVSMRNKVNRLEELFLALVQEKGVDPAVLGRASA